MRKIEALLLDQVVLASHLKERDDPVDILPVEVSQAKFPIQGLFGDRFRIEFSVPLDPRHHVYYFMFE
jgi:hypothetical protein